MARRRKPKSDESVDKNISLLGLVGVQWKVHHTSLLLSPSDRDLQANTILTTSMMSETLKKKCRKMCIVSITRCSSIRRCQSSPPALLVEISLDDELVFIGYFLNWSQSTERVNGFEPLPIYLFKGRSDISRAVNEVLMKNFDFVMTPAELSAAHLVDLLTVFVRFANTDGGKNAVCKYSVPGLSKRDQITVSTNIKGLSVALNYFYETFPEDNVSETFYEKLLGHYWGAYKLNLAHAVLRSVSIPEAIAIHTGEIRMDNEDLLSASLCLVQSFFPGQPVTVAETPSISSNESD